MPGEFFWRRENKEYDTTYVWLEEEEDVRDQCTAFLEASDLDAESRRLVVHFFMEARGILTHMLGYSAVEVNPESFLLLCICNQAGWRNTALYPPDPLRILMHSTAFRSQSAEFRAHLVREVHRMARIVQETGDLSPTECFSSMSALDKAPLLRLRLTQITRPFVALTSPAHVARSKAAAEEKAQQEAKVQEERAARELKKVMKAEEKKALMDARQHLQAAKDAEKVAKGAKDAMTTKRTPTSAPEESKEQLLAAAEKATVDASDAAQKVADAVKDVKSKAAVSLLKSAMAVAARAKKSTEEVKLRMGPSFTAAKKRRATAASKPRKTQRPKSCFCGESHDECFCGVYSDNHYHPRAPTLWHACDYCDACWCGECVGCTCEGPDCVCGGGPHWRRHEDGCKLRASH